jgi:hypothetical protein
MVKRSRLTFTSTDRVIDGYDLEVAWVWSGRRTPWAVWVIRAEDEARLVELPSRGGAS